MSITTLELSKSADSLSEVLSLYENSQVGTPERKAFRDACIQRFEYCIELSWKTSMKLLGSTTAAAKPAVREMARNNLINNPQDWIDFIEARNNSSHSYDEDVAVKVFVQIQKFLPHLRELQKNLLKLKK